MKRWKYRIELMKDTDHCVSRFNEWGDDGWEVFAIFPTPLVPNHHTVHLKKEKQEDEE